MLRLDLFSVRPDMGHVFIDHDIQAVESPEKPMRSTEGEIKFFDFGLRLPPHPALSPGGAREWNWRGGYPVKRAVLVRDDEPTLRIDAQVDPGALGLLRHRIKQLGSKAGQYF